MASESKYAKQDFSQIFYEELKCHICESRLIVGKHHWYKCFAFHSVCQDCKEVKEYKKCSLLCARPIQSEHCKIIEALLNADKMQFKCENLTRGCQVSSDKENMIFHQSECIYRLVKCPNVGCGFEVPFHELLEHMKEKECIASDIASPKGIGKKATFGKKVKEYHMFKLNKSLKPERVEIENKTFFIIGKAKDGTFYHWIHFVGSPQEAKNFSCTLEYFETETEKVFFTQTSEVFSIDETAESIIENGKCFGVSSKYFSSKIGENGRFDYNYEIRNLKEEVKDGNVESGVSDVDE